MTPEEFAAKIKEKYPQYADVPDHDLVSRVVAKYPQYAEQIDTTPKVEKEAPAPDMIDRGLGAVAEWGGVLPGVGPPLAAGAAGVQALRRSETPVAAGAEAMRTGLGHGVAGAGMALGGAPLARLPGIVGAAGRFAQTPGGDAAISGAATLAETGSPKAAGVAALGGLVGGRVLGGGGGRGIIGRGMRSIGNMMRGKGDEVAEAAHRIATGGPPGRAPVDLGSVNTGASPAPVAPPRVAVRAGSPGVQMAAPPQPGPVASPATGSPGAQMRPAPRGRVNAAMRPAARQGRSTAKAAKEASADLSADLLTLSTKMKGQPRLFQEVAADVARLRREAPGLSASTPSGSPGQVANAIVDLYRDKVDGLTPHQAQKIVDMVTEALK